MRNASGRRQNNPLRRRRAMVDQHPDAASRKRAQARMRVFILAVTTASAVVALVVIGPSDVWSAILLMWDFPVLALVAFVHAAVLFLSVAAWYVYYL